MKNTPSMNKNIVRIASILFPKAITSFAYNQLTNPQVRKLRDNEMKTLNKAEKETFKFKDFDIQLYTWKGGDKTILLVHGWEGQAGNFSDLIEILLKNDFTVYSFDGPSHGFSSKGSSSIFDFSDLVGVLIKKYNTKLLVSHSFGGVATTYALFANQDIEIDKYVLITTPDRFIERINEISRKVGITENVKQRLINRLEKEIKINVKTLNVSDFVKEINVNKSLIIHDENDRVIPLERSVKVHQNWKESELMVVNGTGHFRILRTEKVLDKVLDYLN